MSVGDYLACFWPDLGELHLLYESLEASVRATRGEGVCVCVCVCVCGGGGGGGCVCVCVCVCVCGWVGVWVGG